MPKQIMLHTLLNELIAQKLLQPNSQAQIAVALKQEASTPWFISALIAVSAWLSVIPFIAFLAALNIIESSESLIFMGLLLISGTTALQYFKKNGLFVEQLSLAVNLTGQILFIGGIVFGNNLETAAMTTWFLEILLITIYRNNILRFCSVLIATIAALVLLYQFDIYPGIHILIILIAASAIWYWIGEAQHLTDEMMVKVYQPLGYGFIIALQMLLTLSIFPHSNFIPPQTWWFSTIGLTVLLLALEYHILYTNNIIINSKTSYSIFVSTLLVALLLYQAPGIIAAIIILILGFQRGNRILMGMAIISLGVFFIAYYYHLNISLLMKSSTLMTAGLALLALRFVFKRV